MTPNLGGSGRWETAIAHLYVKLAIDSMIYLKVSGAIIFYDVFNAFATLLRRIVFDVDQGDEAWLVKLKNAGFIKPEIDGIYQFIKEHCVSNSVKGV